MAGKSIGTIFVELDLDTRPLSRKQKQIVSEARTTALSVEKNWSILGGQSNRMYDLMRQRAINAYEGIKNSAKVTSAEIIRAERAKNEVLKRIDEEQAGNTTSLIGMLKKNWLGLAATVTAAFYAIKGAFNQVKDVTLAAARFETLGIVMRVVGRNAGFSGAEMEGFAKSLESTGISMLSARQALTQMAQAQLDLNKATVLGRIAQDAAVIANMNSSEAFKQLVYGIQSANVRVLRTMGINVNFEQGYASLARQLGKTTASLTDSEKATSRMNTVLEAGVRISGTYEGAMETAGKQLLSLERHFENLKVLIGAAFTPALSEIVEQITGAVVGFNKELSGESKDAVNDWGVNFRLVMISVEAEILRLSMFIDKVGGTLTTIKAIAGGVTDLVKGIFGGEGTAYKDAVAQNDALRERYEKSEKQLQALADKYVSLEYSISDAGKAAAKTQKEIADSVKPSTAAGGGGDTGMSLEELAKRQQARERYYDAIAKKISEEQRAEEELGEVRKYTGMSGIEVTERILKAREDQTKATIALAIAEQEANEQGITMADVAAAQAYAAEDQLKAAKAFSKEIENFVVHGFDSMANAVAQFVTTGKLNFKSFAESVIGDLARIAAKMLALKAIKSIGFAFLEQGGVMQGGKLTPFARGGVVDSPTIFPMANGYGLMGEAGPEAVMPLTRSKTGELGVRAEPVDFLGGGSRERLRPIQLILDGRILTEWLEDQSRVGMYELRPA